MNCENLETIILYLKSMEKQNLKDLLRTLVELDKKAEAIGELATEIRVEINELFWDLAKSKKNNNDTVNVYDLHD